MSEAQIDPQQLQQLPEQLLQVATRISMQLGIPMLDDPIDINFITQCINTILGGLNNKWKSISFQPKNQQQLQEAWRKIFHIVQSAMLSDDQKILQANEQIGMESFAALFQVLLQGCQALRHENLQPVTQNQLQKSKKQNKNKNPESRQKDGHKKSIQKNRNQKKEVKERPKTSKNRSEAKNIYQKKLEQQIIQNVVKTMSKRYQTKAQPKRIARIRQKQGTQAVQKVKRNLDYAIKDYQINHKIAENKSKKTTTNNIKKDIADNTYLKMIQNKHRKLNNQIENQQLRYYLQLRDKKVAYIRHIHKLIQKLQRQRQIQSHKQQRQLQILKKKELIQKIQTVQNLFDHNMQKLQQNYKQRRRVQQMQNVGEIQVCRAMQKNIKQKKMKQMQSIKDLWNQQRNQLFKITNDEQKMKNRLIEVYRKYRVR